MKEEYKILETRLVPISEVKENEERDFTPWLEKNIHCLDMNLEPIERESKVYEKLRVDLLAETLKKELVIIENQYGTSNNDHLAKILIYCTGSKAKVGIWIAEKFREEHKQVITKLNNSGAYNIYLIEVSAKKIIESSNYIIDFTVIVAPDYELRNLDRIKERIKTETDILYRRFWEHLLKINRDKTDLFSGRKGTIGNWVATSAGVPGVSYIYSAVKKEVRIELYIDTGDKIGNKEIFDELEKKKKIIEEIFGTKLNWERMDHARASRIRYTISDRDWRDESRWVELHEEMIDAMIRFEVAISPNMP